MPDPIDLQLGLIGNCQIAALVDVHARIVWCCLPRPDGDPVFSALLTARGATPTTTCGPTTDAGPTYPLPNPAPAMAHPAGVFAIDLCDAARASHEYLRNTAILTTTLHDLHGNALRITDFCPRFRNRGRMFRPVTLVRVVEPLAGRPVARIRIEPTSNYGASRPQVRTGSHHLSFASDSLGWRVTTDASLSSILEGRLEVIERPLAFVLGPDESLAEAPLSLARQWLEETRNYWHDWVRTLAIPFEWQEAVIRAAISLKLCTYEDTGAVLAALTTSIPEAPDSGRNWDYRYCWLRDAYFVVQALNRLGATRTMEHLLNFLDHTVARTDRVALQPLYGIGGGAQLPERIVESLAGYRGMGPVRVGNAAYGQIQHDVYGAVILAATQMFFDQRLTNLGDAATFTRLERIGESAIEVFAQPDAGPWEFRGIAQVHTFSALMSWAGCDRLARIAASLGLPERAAWWREHAARMRQQLLARAWNAEHGRFSSVLDGAELDATLLLLPEYGLVEGTDPRFLATLEAVQQRLQRGRWLMRYIHPDDFGRPETAFTICGFWHVNALHAAGRRTEARELFQDMLASRTHLGLLSEDIDPRSGELWGNFPQTYSLVGIIQCATRLSRPWEDAR
ncbi:MAG: glycoside hydrolase family 15 protein [Steroidobacteraceae bacterium]